MDDDVLCKEMLEVTVVTSRGGEPGDLNKKGGV